MEVSFCHNVFVFLYKIYLNSIFLKEKIFIILLNGANTKLIILLIQWQEKHSISFSSSSQIDRFSRIFRILIVLCSILGV